MVNFINFPAVTNANEDGLLAMGGELSVDTLISAYSQGIFPWFNEGQPVLWWSPDPRLVLYPSEVKISRSLAKVIRQQRLRVSCDEAFEAVLKGCARRSLQKPFSVPAETWITPDMHRAYCRLHQEGYAHSVEVWQAETLVGGLYGIILDKVFFGESMFSDASNASKVALVALCQNLQAQEFALIDCQVETEHLRSMGAVDIARSEFMHYLQSVDIQANSADFATGFMQPVA